MFRSIYIEKTVCVLRRRFVNNYLQTQTQIFTSFNLFFFFLQFSKAYVEPCVECSRMFAESNKNVIHIKPNKTHDQLVLL